MARAAGTKRKTASESALGPLLRQWRERRRMSQLTLAVEAEVSSRHLSFIETGRAKPSREMVLLLARVLEVPPRGRNELLLAAGYAPVYLERGLESPEMTQVRRALDFMLRQQEPFPALVVDGHWNVLMSNEGMQRVMGLFLDPAQAATLGPANAMRLFYHPRGVRPYIVNWEATAAALIQWLHRDLLPGGSRDRPAPRRIALLPGRAAPLAQAGSRRLHRALPRRGAGPGRSPPEVLLDADEPRRPL